MGKSWFVNEWTFREIDKDGNVVFEDKGLNSLTNQGEEALLETFFRNGTQYAPVQFYIRLCNDTLTQADTLSSISGEPMSNGYAPQLVERSDVGFSTKQLDEGDFQLVSKEVAFTASGGDIGPVTTAFLATSLDNSGILVCFRALPIARIITSGNRGLVQMKIKLKPGN